MTAAVRLSPHFHESEFTSPGRTRVPPGYRAELRHLCRAYLEPLRERFGPVTVTSGHRTVKHNAAVGGARLSRHLDLRGASGAAADVVAATGGPREWYELLDRLGCPGLGLYEDHVHADTRDGRARW